MFRWVGEYKTFMDLYYLASTSTETLKDFRAHLTQVCVPRLGGTGLVTCLQVKAEDFLNCIYSAAGDSSGIEIEEFLLNLKCATRRWLR